MRRGELYYADLSDAKGCEQGGFRPVLIVQNDIGNTHSKTTIVLPITTKVEKSRSQPTHIFIKSSIDGLKKCSVVLAEQIRTIDKERIKKHIGQVSEFELSLVTKAILISVGITTNE